MWPIRIGSGHRDAHRGGHPDGHPDGHPHPDRQVYPRLHPTWVLHSLSPFFFLQIGEKGCTGCPGCLPLDAGGRCVRHRLLHCAFAAGRCQIGGACGARRGRAVRSDGCPPQAPAPPPLLTTRQWWIGDCLRQGGQKKFLSRAGRAGHVQRGGEHGRHGVGVRLGVRSKSNFFGRVMTHREGRPLHCQRCAFAAAVSPLPPGATACIARGTPARQWRTRRIPEGDTGHRRQCPRSGEVRQNF